MSWLTNFLDPRPTYVVCTDPNCDPEGHKGAVWHPGQPIPKGVRLIEQTANSKVKPREVIFETTIFRCGCGDPDSHNGSPRCRCGVTEWHPAHGEIHICPKPRAVVQRGVVSYYHRNPLKRLRWRLYHWQKDRELRQQGE